MSKFNEGDVVRTAGSVYRVLSASDDQCWATDSEGRLRCLPADEVILVKAADETKQESATKGHPHAAVTAHVHAALMAEYAKDAAETDKPWERWQYECRFTGEWKDLLGGNLGWALDRNYRRKPAEKWVNLYTRVSGGMSVRSACGYDVGGNLYDTEEAARKCASAEKGYIGTVKIEVPSK